MVQTSGFRTFAFSFHLPYVALRRRKSHKGDERTYKDGKSVRWCRRLDFLGDDIHLYEAQVSMLVTGFDERRYDSVLFADAVFDKSISMKHYHRDPFVGLKRPDPLLKGAVLVDKTICFKPRTYFLKAFQAWLEHLEKEWQANVDMLKPIIDRKYVGRWCQKLAHPGSKEIANRLPAGGPIRSVLPRSCPLLSKKGPTGRRACLSFSES